MAIQMDIYDSLRQDHRSVQKILEQMVQTSENDASRRTELLERFKMEFLAHARAEEKLLYSQLEKNSKTHDLALEGTEEHHAAEQLMQELEDLDPQDEHWKAKATVLQEMVNHHVKEEEESLFPKAKEVFSSDEAMQLAQRFEDQKQAEQQHI